MTGVGADNTPAHNGTQLGGGAKLLPFGPGDRIAEKYEVIRALGRGGVAFVVAARNVELDEIVALKFLRQEFLGDADLVDRFASEARASAKIENEHVAHILDVGAMPDGAPFIVREYLDGKDLGALLREAGTAPVECACEFLLQACEGLASAHALGIVHRDVKPDNLFLARSTQGLDVIKVLDFGISKLALTGSVIDGSGPHLTSMAVRGTPLYMSPEQIRNSSHLDARTDIWSLGCVLYRLLTGHAPFEASSITSLTASILEQPAPLMRERCPDVPEELETVVARCLAKNPDHRFQSVSQLAAALYPLAPRRARLSVERCSQILRHAGLTPVPIVLRTIPPPSHLPADLAATLQTTAENTRRTSDEPAHVDVPLAAPAPARRWKWPLLAGFCMLVVAGAFAARRPDFGATFAGATSIASTKGPEAPPSAGAAATPTTGDTTSPAPATTDLTEKANTSEVGTLDAKTPPIGSAAPKPRSHKPRKGISQTGTTQEIDVGF
jgi:serine/threonine-protein kinase